MKSNMPTTYDGIQQIIVNCASLLLFAGNVVDAGRQIATSQVPKIKAGIEKIPCKAFITSRKGVFENTSVEVLNGFMSSTKETPIHHAQITVSIVISCTK